MNYLVSPCASPGLAPEVRMLTTFLRMSNQKGAPCMAASALIVNPKIFMAIPQPLGGFAHTLQDPSQGMPNTS